MAENKKPAVDASLLEYLDKLFPDKCPEENATERSIWIEVGSRKVVKHLKALHEAQIRENLTRVL